MVTVPRSEKKERTRARLLAAAAKVFATKGYFGAAVDDVALEAGLTKGAVYAHFRSKEGLYLALTVEQGRRQLDEAQSALEATTTTQERLDWAAERFARAVSDRARMGLEFEFFSYAARDPKIRREVRQLERRVIEVNAAFYQRMWEDKRIKPPIAAEDFHRLQNGLAMQLAKEALLDPKLDITDTAKRLFRFLWASVA